MPRHVIWHVPQVARKCNACSDFTVWVHIYIGVLESFVCTHILPYYWLCCVLRHVKHVHRHASSMQTFYNVVQELACLARVAYT